MNTIQQEIDRVLYDLRHGEISDAECALGNIRRMYEGQATETKENLLLVLADELEMADRVGRVDDDPEGARWIEVSDTLANVIVKRLREQHGKFEARVAELEAELAPYRKARAAVERMIGDGYDVVVDWSDMVGGEPFQRWWVAFTHWQDFEMGDGDDADLGRAIDKAIEDVQVQSADDHDEYLTGEEVGDD